MLNKVLEIREEGRYISQDRGFISIKNGNETLGKVSFDEVGTLLVSAQAVTLSKHVLNELAQRGCPTLLCGNNYIPQSIVLPFDNYYQSAKMLKLQINASEPFKKRIWQQIVIGKICNQSLVLSYVGKEKEAKKIKKISTLVKSGDPDNREAYAARMYWQYLFGKTFRRNRELSGINTFLNYGYAVMRAAMARAVCSNGLLPALGVYHCNNLNGFCLVDDFFEVYRPMIDLLVYHLVEPDMEELTVGIKQRLINGLRIKVHAREGDTPAFQSMFYMVASYVKALEEKKPLLELPDWEGNIDGITIIE